MGARLRELRECQWRSPDELEGVAVTRLRRLLDHAATHVPFYRRVLGDAGLGPGDVRSLADLSRVPVTTRASLKAAGLDQTTADNLGPGRGWPMMSSGSTGIPFGFHADLAAEDTRLATYMLALEWAGVGVWDVEIRAAGQFPDAPWKYRRPGLVARVGRRALLGQRSARLMAPWPTPEDLQQLILAVAGRRPWFLRGFPSFIAPLGDRLLQAGSELTSYPKVVMSRGETLTAVRRATIERAFRCRVVDHYATNEVPHLAQSCPDGEAGLHILGDRAIVRVVRDDGLAASPGEAGRVLLTDLENYAMPFINYAVGDRAVVGRPCACGRGLPVLAALDGREAEIIRLPAGREVSTFTVDSFMRRQSDIRTFREYQIVQTARDRVEIRLLATPEFTPRAADHLREGFGTFLGAGVTVAVVAVDAIPSEPSGKRFAVKSEVGG